MAQATDPTIQPQPLRMSRVLQAGRAAVFAAWSSREQVMQWFAPATYTVSDARIACHAGGAFEVCMRSPGGVEHWTRGTFVEVVPPSRLVIDMRVSDLQQKLLFTAHTVVGFAEDPAGTRLDVAQSYAFVDPAMAAPMVAGAAEGWRTTLDKLEKLAGGM